MATIAENLQKILDIKADIKSAIQNKGVNVSDSDKFETYPSLISSIPQEGGGGGECDEEHYLEYEWVTNGITRCYDNDLGVQYVPELTYKGEKYTLNNTPTKIEIEEKDNYDCKCHQLLVETVNGGSTTISINYTTSFYVYSGEPFIVENSEDWTTLKYFFGDSANIKKILHFPLCPNVEDASYFIQNTKALEDFSGLKGLITDKCTNLNGIFNTLPLIENFDTHLLEWDTSNVSNFGAWFGSSNTSSPMKRIDLTGFSYESVTTNSNMLKINYLPNDLYELIVGNFKLEIDSAMALFNNVKNLERVVFKDIDWTNTYASSVYVFYPYNTFYTSSYIEWDNVKIKATSTTATWSYPFGTDVSKLKEIKLNNVIIDVQSISSFFYSFPLKTLDLTGVDVSNVKKLSSTFNNCTNLEELNLSGWNLDNSNFGDNTQFTSTNNLKVIYVCGCSETTKQKILDAVNRNSSLKDKVELLSKTKTDNWRWSSDIDTFCENQQLYSVHYKEYEWSCDAEEAEWRKDYSEYQIVSIIDSEECHYTIEVTLNNDWQPLTEDVSAPNGKDGSIMDGTIFESFSNCVVKGYKYGDAKIRIKFNKIPNFKIWIKSETANQDTRYDYTVASNLDTEITKTQPAYNDSSIKYYTYNVTNNPWVECDYSNDGGEHFIDIVYRNDASGNYGLDKGFVFIPYEGVTIEENPSEPDRRD